MTFMVPGWLPERVKHFLAWWSSPPNERAVLKCINLGEKMTDKDLKEMADYYMAVLHLRRRFPNGRSMERGQRGSHPAQ